MYIMSGADSLKPAKTLMSPRFKGFSFPVSDRRFLSAVLPLTDFTYMTNPLKYKSTLQGLKTKGASIFLACQFIDKEQANELL